MTDGVLVVRGNRRRLLAQAGLIVAVGALGAVALQRWEVIAVSPLGRLDALVPLPLLFLVVTGLAVAIAIAIVKDSWGHHVEFRLRELYVRTARGAFMVPYEAIADIKELPWYGVGIALKDPDAWLQRLDQQPGAPPDRRKLAAVLRTARGVDIGLLEKNLSIGGKQFADLLRHKQSTHASNGPGEAGAG